MIVHFPATFEPGINHLLKAKHHPQANIDLSLLVLQKGESYTSDIEKEVVAVLLSGHILAEVEVLSEELVRSDVFYGEPQVVHVPKSTAFTLTGRAARSEIMLVATCNPKRFKPAILHPLDMLSPKEIRGVGLMNDSAVRTAYTFLTAAIARRPISSSAKSLCPRQVVKFPSPLPPRTEFYFTNSFPKTVTDMPRVNGGVQIVRQHSLTVMCRKRTPSAGYDTGLRRMVFMVHSPE